MTGAFLYLSLRSARNRFRSAIRRLKRPKYLISFLVGAGYFYGFALRHWIHGFTFAQNGGSSGPPSVLVEIAAAVLLFLGAAVAWCGTAPVSPLAFTETEIQFLFPAPISRRGVVAWRLMKGQVGVLISVIFFTLVASPHLAPGRAAIFFLGSWMVFATMQLHLTGIRLSRFRLENNGWGWTSRALTTLVLLSIAAAASGLWSFHRVGPPAVASIDVLQDLPSLTAYVERLFGTGPAVLILLPMRLLVRPALATDLIGFLVAVPAALILLGLNVAWVLRTAVDLEEGALESARRLDEARARARRGAVRRPARFRRIRPLFRLSPTGPPEIALLWKNLICMTRDIGGIRPLVLIVAGSLLPTFIILSATGGTAVALPVLGMMCAMLAFALLAIGPGLFRTEFRQEVLHIERLKPYPLEGREIVVGTIAAPVVVLTAVQWLLLIGCASLAAAQPSFNSQWLEHPGLLAMTAAVLVLPVNMVSALVHMAALLLVPGWTALGSEQTTGMERFGQSIIATLGRMLALALGLLPAAIAFAVAWFFTSAFVSAQSALPLSAIPAAVVASMEGWVGIQLLGTYVEGFDPSRELDSIPQ